jgi:hypothetical protein
LEDCAAGFDSPFGNLAQRRGFRDYLQGLLLPRHRNKTLTGLAGAEPIAGAQHREVQRLQWFLTESAWDHEVVNERRVRRLCEDPATAPHDGALVVDDTGDRKDGTATAHVARQYLGSVGKVDNGIVAMTSLWADERCYWPVQAVPYTPAARLPGGERDPWFKTKPRLAVELVEATSSSRGDSGPAASAPVGDKAPRRRRTRSARWTPRSAPICSNNPRAACAACWSASSSPRQHGTSAPKPRPGRRGRQRLGLVGPLGCRLESEAGRGQRRGEEPQRLTLAGRRRHDGRRRGTRQRSRPGPAAWLLDRARGGVPGAPAPARSGPAPRPPRPSRTGAGPARSQAMPAAAGAVGHALTSSASRATTRYMKAWISSGVLGAPGTSPSTA